MKIILSILLFTLVLVPNKMEAVNDDGCYVVNIKSDPAQEYIEELEKFVRSVNMVKYQPESYWKEVDVLWDSLNNRKEELKDQFTKRQRQRIARLERKYHKIREKQAKWS